VWFDADAAESNSVQDVNDVWNENIFKSDDVKPQETLIPNVRLKFEEYRGSRDLFSLIDLYAALIHTPLCALC